MPGQEIKKQYINLINLLNHYSLDATDKARLKETHAFCSTLYKVAQAHPDILFAQTILYKKALPYVVNITFNACVYTLLFCIRNKFDSALTIQLMCASISLYALQQNALKKYYQDRELSETPHELSIGESNPKFLALLKHFKQQAWIRGYSICNIIHQTKPSQLYTLDRITSVTYLANKLALLTTPNSHHKHSSFVHTIKYLTTQSPASWYALIAPLMSYPSLIPPGSYIKQNNGDLNVVIAITNTTLVTKPLNISGSPSNASKITSMQEIKISDIRQSYASQSIMSFTRINEWWDGKVDTWLTTHKSEAKVPAFDSYLPIQHAPGSLLVLQDQLARTDVDITVVVKALEKEPAYVNQVLKYASSINRQKQPVRTVQHGLAMLGLERSSNLLLQHCLLARLNQQYFPLQQAFLNFNQLMASIANNLSFTIKTVSPDMASTLTYFALSRLFSFPSFRLLTQWNTLVQAPFKIENLFDNKDNIQLKKGAILLAKAWQQPNYILSTLQAYDLLPHIKPTEKVIIQLSYLLGLSLLTAREIYFSDTQNDTETSHYLKHATKALGTTETEINRIKINTATENGIYCQIN